MTTSNRCRPQDPAKPAIDRVRYHYGARLASRDLDEDARFESRLRSLHVRALHDTWGVALGFDLTRDATQKHLTVGPGLAYDICGREIVLSSEVTLTAPVPPSHLAGTYLVIDLLCSYAATEDLAAVPADGLGCGGTQPVDRPSLRWSIAGPFVPGVALPLAEDVRLGQEIPLGRFRLGLQGDLRNPDQSLRRTIRRLLRPHIAWAVTGPADEIKWHPAVNGVTWLIDTLAGSFSSVPFYLARLAKNPWAHSPGVAGPFLSIYDPQPDSFKLHMLFLSPPGINPLLQTHEATVLWVGVEPFTGCPPSPSPPQIASTGAPWADRPSDLERAAPVTTQNSLEERPQERPERREA